jgi:hypothetical protein
MSIGRQAGNDSAWIADCYADIVNVLRFSPTHHVVWLTSKTAVLFAKLAERLTTGRCNN